MRSYDILGSHLGDTAARKSQLTIPVSEQKKDARNEPVEAVSLLARRDRTQQVAQDQVQIEGADMNRLPLQNVFPPA